MRKARAAVIGSGFGGLACAIRLQKSGYDVTIYEQRDKPGGRAYVYHDEGFTFDAGPTVVTAPHCIEELFDSKAQQEQYFKLVEVTPFYKLLWENGTSFDYCNDDEKLKRQILDINAEDWEGYLRFKEYSKKVFEAGYEDLAHVPFLKVSDMFKVAPQLIKLKSYKSVYSIVSQFIKHDKLRQAFSFHSLLVGGNPFSTSSIYTLIHFLERKWGVFFPEGGTGAMVSGLVSYFEDLGGKIKLSEPVERILTLNGNVSGVQTKNGAERYDFVVSNADVNFTYNRLLEKEPLVKSKQKSLNRARYSMSLFLIYFGTNKTYENLEHHNVVFGPRYKSLLTDIFSKGKLSQDFSLYLHRPTATDKSLAPEGCDNFYVLSPVPHLGKAQIDWDMEKDNYADSILSYLEKHYMPGLKEHLVTKRIFTPYDFKMELGAFHGSAFSLEPVLQQSAYFRTHNRDSRLGGLYFVGAGTHPGAGIPGVINSAKATSAIILEGEQKERHAAL